MYLYIVEKNPQPKSDLWIKTKSEYKDIDPLFLESLDSYIEASGKKNEGERGLVSSLLVISLSHLASLGEVSKMPKALKKDEHGKPYFEDFDIGFNIAHSDNLVVIAYGENEKIGVDTEGEIEEKRAEHLSARFPQITSLKVEKHTKKIEAYEVNENGEVSAVNLDFSKEDFTTKWTMAEALMKCDGRGFSLLPSLEKLAEEMKIYTLVHNTENTKNYISVAIKE